MNKNIIKINALLTIISVVLVIVAIFSESENKKFKEKGIETKAGIVNTHKVREASGTASKMSYKADVMFFTDKEDLISTDIYIDKEAFDTLTNEHELIIYYLTENPEEARLKSMVFGFSISVMYVISGSLLFVVLILWHLAKRYANKKATE